MRADRYGDDVSNLCWVRKASAARSPPTTQLAMELPGGNARHDRPARNAKVVASGHGASPHLGGAGLMPVGYDGIADKILEFRTLQIFWHHLALRKGAKCGRAADLAAEFYAGYCGLQIVGIRQIICVNLNGVERIGPHKSLDRNRLSTLSLMPATTASAPDLC